MAAADVLAGSPRNDRPGLEYIPLGFPLGVRIGEGPGNSDVLRIRLGPRVTDLPAALYDAWVAVRSRSVDPGLEPPSIAKLRRLQELGLLARCKAGRERALQQLASLRLTCSGIGAGNSKGRPDLFAIISQEQRPLALVDARTYAVWSRGGGGATVASACSAAGDELGDPDRVQHAFLEALPALLSGGLVFLEPAAEA